MSKIIAESQHQRQIKKANKVADKDLLAFAKVSVERLERTDSVKIKIEYRKGDTSIIYTDTGKVVVIDCDSIRLINKSNLVAVKCPPSTDRIVVDTLYQDKEIIKYNRAYEIVLQGELDKMVLAYDEIDNELRAEKQDSKRFKKQRNKLIWGYVGIGIFGIIILVLKFYGSKFKILKK